MNGVNMCQQEKEQRILRKQREEKKKSRTG